jgi:hypothetical protein
VDLLLTYNPGAWYIQETDDIVSNKDKSNGPVFQPPRNDYAQTVKVGAKNSKDRSQYDTGNLCHLAGGCILLIAVSRAEHCASLQITFCSC